MRITLSHFHRIVLFIGVFWTMIGSIHACISQPIYEIDMITYIEKIDKEYPFFELKDIRNDWDQAKQELKERARKCKSNEEFLQILMDSITVLRDAHMYVRPSTGRIPEQPKKYRLDISFLPATKNRVVVMYPPNDYKDILQTGTIITKIDGMNAREFLENKTQESWKKGGPFSSIQRARLFEYRMPLRGEKGQNHTISYLNGDKENTIDLECNKVVYGWHHTYNQPFNMNRASSTLHYINLDNDIGYMYLRKVDAKMPKSMQKALDMYPNMNGWIVDLRGNGGGGYTKEMFDLLERFPQPVAVLIDAGCISAGETLARDFRRCAKAKLFGSYTAGSSSSKYDWPLPFRNRLDTNLTTKPLETRSKTH
jgi:hypothetical protein